MGERDLSLGAGYEPTTSDPLPLDERERSGRRLALRLVPGYVVLILIGIGLFRFGGAMERGNELSLGRSVFTAVNAATLTGFQQDMRINESSHQGPVMLFALTLGGTLFSLVVGGLAVTRILQLPYGDRQIVVGSFAAVTIAILLGTIGVIDPRQRTFFESVFLALSAFANSGLYLGRLGDVHDAHVHAVLLPLALFGGLGITVLLELFDRIAGVRFLSMHTRTVLTLPARLYLIFLGLFFLVERPTGAAMTSESGALPAFQHTLMSASSAAVNARGAGFPLDYIGGLPRTMPWVLILLMIIGGNPGGTAGGLKGTTLVELFRGVRAALKGRPVRRAFGVAAAWGAIYGGIALTGFLLLTWLTPDLTADRSLFLAVSAASNVGLSHDPIAVTGAGLYVLSAIMLVGRIAPLLVLWWMVRAAPESEVAVG